jgi:hypothetical protein
MKSATRLFVFPLLAGAVFAAGCSDKGSPMDPDEGTIGSMSYAYEGDITGSFSASGRVPATSPEGKTWAFAMREGNSGPMLVEASRQLQNNRYDHTLLAIHGSAPGTYAINGDCGEEDCTGVLVFFGMETGDDADFDRMCTLSSGSITVASASNGRARGSFSGEGTCIGFAGDEMMLESFSVRNGQFDTPLANH